MCITIFIIVIILFLLQSSEFIVCDLMLMHFTHSQALHVKSAMFSHVFYVLIVYRIKHMECQPKSVLVNTLNSADKMTVCFLIMNVLESSCVDSST